MSSAPGLSRREVVRKLVHMAVGGIAFGFKSVHSFARRSYAQVWRSSVNCEPKRRCFFAAAS